MLTLLTATPPALDFGLAERFLTKFAGPLTAIFILAGIAVAIKVLAGSLTRIGEELAPAADGRSAVKITIGGILSRIGAIAVVTLIAVVVLNNGLDVFKWLVDFVYKLADAPAVSPSPAP